MANAKKQQPLIKEDQIPNGLITPQMLSATTTIAKGDLYYVDQNGKFQRLPIGTVGQTLKVSSSGLPYWG